MTDKEYDSQPIYIKVEQVEDAVIGFTPQIYRDGEFVDTDQLEKQEPCGVHSIYAHLLVQALHNDKGLKMYMEQLLTDFGNFIQEQKDGKSSGN